MIFLPMSNVSFCEWFKLYKFFCLIFLCTCLIKTHGFAFTNGWMVKTTITIFYRQIESSVSPQSCLCQYESQSSKFLNSCIAIVWEKFLFAFILFHSLSNKDLPNLSLMSTDFFFVVKKSKQLFLMNELLACKFHYSR